jgi:hypothetical protein
LKRAQQNGIYDRENGGVSADAESEGQDGNSREAGILAQQARAEAQILQ